MGAHDVHLSPSAEARARFIRAVLEDLDTLEVMLGRGMLDAGHPMIGAEQEYLLVDERLQPAPVNAQVLARANEKRLTTELGRFNVEANLTPLPLRGACFSILRRELEHLTTIVRAAAREEGADVMLLGIPPHFEAGHARLDAMTPCARFERLNEKTMSVFGGRVPLVLRGRDVLNFWHDNIMLEAAATSFQVHLQVSPSTFARSFNSALLTAGPLVAASGWSPLMGGARLWHETRIPLLELCADVRNPARMRRGGRARTSLGSGWVRESPIELFRRDLADFDFVLDAATTESSAEVLRSGGIPKLAALGMFNGSNWPWMRACYGVTNGKPHLRIENRVLSAGPTIADELANAALWIGMMAAVPAEYGDPSSRLPFEDVEANFLACARHGLDAELRWIDGRRIRARTLLSSELIPMARAGLRAMGVGAGDIRATLDVVEERVRSGRTGAQWMLDTFEALPSERTRRRRAWDVARRIQQYELTNQPVHTWTTAPHAISPADLYSAPVGIAMRTDVPSVRPDDLLELAERLVSWDPGAVVLVEDDDGAYRGVLGAAELARLRAAGHDVLADAELPSPRTVELHEGLGRVLAEMVAGDESCRVVLDGTHALGVVIREDLEALLAGGATDRARGTGVREHEDVQADHGW